MRTTIALSILSLSLATSAFAGHTAAVGQGTCSYCHKVDLVTQHGGFLPNVCSTCHDSTAPSVTSTITAGVAGTAYACSNCHGNQSHLSQHGTYITAWNSRKGVQPAAALAGTQPGSYTVVNPAAKQYQACYTCHSGYALGTNLSGGVSAITGPSGARFADVAMDFNLANLSAHPIQGTLNQQTGATAPKALAAAQMASPWLNVGNQTMNCSDCHISGSTNKFMLPSGTSWPVNPATNKFWTLSDLNSTTSGWQTKLFCAKCHPMKTSGSWLNNVHGTGDHTSSYTINGISYNGVPCVSCHVAVPHGANRARLIGFDTDPAPYNAYDANGKPMLVLKGFRKAARNSYSESSSCLSSVGACSDHSNW